MKALVFSDSHGALNAAIEMVTREKDCLTVFFLGDGARDLQRLIELFPDRKFIAVKGNNDFHSSLETEASNHFEGVTIMSTHGHIFDVRYTLSSLLKKAQSVRAHVALYGHTHKADMYNDPVTGVCAINPGALCERKYCVLTFEKGQFDIEFKSI